MKSEEDWSAFEKNYEAFIMEYADMAREIDAEMLCIGTELNGFVNARPEFWQQLIKKIKKVYPGKLTYAENWDTFNKVPFWNELDYVGVDAYFPLCQNKTPSLETLKQGWQNHKPKITALHAQTNKPILFTEYGYRSVDYSGKRPWDFSRDMTTVNLEAQENALKAIYEEFWKEDWFAGGFLWKWHDNHEKSGGKDNTRFTPQNKPAEALVRKFYGAGVE
jgi:ppGpp synthetase/RelA/SpoT-type nucleotidyltranferase